MDPEIEALQNRLTRVESDIYGTAPTCLINSISSALAAISIFKYTISTILILQVIQITLLLSCK